jgi:hypothetical protein
MEESLQGFFHAAIEALIRTRLKIQNLYVCKIDPEARGLAAARLQILSKMFPELLPSKAFASCFSFLPHDIALIKQEHIQNLGLVDLIICGFHVKVLTEQLGKHRDFEIHARQYFLTW